MFTPRVLFMTCVSMVAFAGNSLLARIALKHTSIDATSFTVLRLASGALILWMVVRSRARRPLAGGLPSALVLFAYAITFSFAYVGLPAGAGALIMFGAAQGTMIGYGVWKGERLGALQVAGLVAAMGGLVALLAPGLSAPPLGPAVLMLAAGVGWGIYCLLGSGQGQPLEVTAGNFIRCMPVALAFALVMLPHLNVDPGGVACAVISGAIASGLAYVMWYMVIRSLTTIAASVVQLTIPVLVSMAGVWLLGEPVTQRLVIASGCVLGGVALVILRRRTVRARP